MLGTTSLKVNALALLASRMYLECYFPRSAREGVSRSRLRRFGRGLWFPDTERIIKAPRAITGSGALVRMAATVIS
jgi:hypothetical protein